MEKHKRIYWKIGLDLTPEIFIEADNYHISQRSILTQSYAFRTYGILPDTNFKISYRLNHDSIFIDELYCMAITRNGHLIDVQNDVSFKGVSLSELSDDEPFYMVLNVDSFHPKSSGKEELYAKASYSIETIDLKQNIVSGIPILKVGYNRKKRCKEVDNNYVVPHISLSTSNVLIEKYHTIKDVLSIINKKLPTNELTFYLMELLEVELNNYCLQEFPAELILLLKKICTILKSYLKRQNKEEFDEMKIFLNEIYNHNEILDIILKGIDCLKIINQKIDEKVEIIEEPVQKAPPLILPEI